MDIDRIFELKTKMEADISEIINSFQKETGFNVRVTGYKWSVELEELFVITTIESGNITIST